MGKSKSKTKSTFVTAKQLATAIAGVKVRIAGLPVEAYAKLDVDADYLAKRAMESGYAGDRMQMAALILLSLAKKPSESLGHSGEVAYV